MSIEPAVFKQTFDLYSKGEYAQAYDLITKAQDKFPEWKSLIFEFRFDIAAAMKKLDLAEEILEQALNEGFFYNEIALRKESDLRQLQGRPRFEALVKRSFDMLYDHQNIANPKMRILEPYEPKSDGSSFMMALHGNNSNVDLFSGYWQSLIQTNWLVALPQSSQVSGKGFYVWNDFVKIEKEIDSHYKSLTNNYALNPQKSIIVGFSKGGHAAIHCALKGILPVKGFIGLAAYIADLDLISTLLTNAEQKKLRGYFILGEEDHDCTPGALALIEKLKEYGIACGVEMFEGMGHEIPEDFKFVLQRAVKFIFNE